MRIHSNISSLFAQRQLGINNDETAKQIEKLSSGLRINRAGDDASGLAVSEKMRAQIRGLNQASRNTQDAVSFIQTAEGYLDETTSILQRLRELAVQAANGIYSDEDRQLIQIEVSQLVDEIDRIASHAQFNGMNILTGRFARNSLQTMRFQVGANMDQGIDAYIGTMTASALGLRDTQGGSERLSISDTEQANRAIGTLDSSLKQVTAQRANLGAYQNRLETAKKGIDIASENTQAAESKIRDADMASELVKFTSSEILRQAATAMLAQANASGDLVLKLLQ
jgi:flagellin